MYSNRELLRDVWFYLKPYKWKFFGATLARISGDIAWLYPGYALATLVNFFGNYSVGVSLQPIYLVFVCLMLVTVIRYLSLYVSKVTAFRIAEKIELNAEVTVMRHLFLLDISWHEMENAGNKLKRISKAVYPH